MINKKEFREIWKKMANSDKRLPVLETVTYYGGRTIKVRKDGLLTPELHIVYNIVRGFPIEKGFKKDSIGFKLAKQVLLNTRYSGKDNNGLSFLQDYITKEQLDELRVEVKAFI
jgi:hypothetical protein